jgi:hypothetical protein
MVVAAAVVVVFVVVGKRNICLIFVTYVCIFLLCVFCYSYGCLCVFLCMCFLFLSFFLFPGHGRGHGIFVLLQGLSQVSLLLNPDIQHKLCAGSHCGRVTRSYYFGMASSED